MTAQAQFVTLFDAWADSFDATVTKRDGEYAEVFEGYDRILSRVIAGIEREPGATVVDVGTGTGNLAKLAVSRGFRTAAVEPSANMRQHAARVPGLTVFAGDFLDVPLRDGAAAAVISSYAFHHVTDSDKPAAVRELGRVLDSRGHIVIADTAFVDEAARAEVMAWAAGQRFWALLQDLQTEYYPTLGVLERAFREGGFAIESFARLNRFVWVWRARRANA